MTRPLQSVFSSESVTLCNTPGRSHNLGEAMKLSSKIYRPIFAALFLTWQVSAYALPAKSEVPPFGQDVTANGYARLPTQSVVNYTETYLDNPLDNTIRASYWSGNRELIAFKKLIFNSDSNVPEYYESIDYRRSKGYRVSVDSNVAKVETIKLGKDGTEIVTRNKSVDVTDKTVIDAGFHRFVVSNWDRLMSGRSVKVKFLQVDKARLVPLKIKKTQCNTPDTACYKISLDNFLLQGVVPAIQLKYDISTKRLISYAGIGPITQLSGKGLPVEVLYEYIN